MKNFFIFLSIVTAISQAGAFTELKTDSIRSVEQTIREKGKQYGPQNVLVVLDVDSTLLTPYSDLGSSFWTSWQFGLLKTPEIEPEQVALNLDGLYLITDKIRAMYLMRPVEPETTTVVNEIEKEGYPTIVLTGQPPMMRKTAEWQLKKNGMTFTKPKVGNDIAETWKIGKGFDTADLTDSEIQAFNFESPADVSYKNGIFLGHDQNKGGMLRGLLHRLKLSDQYKAIVFLDDSASNIRDMKAAYENKLALDFADILYTHEHVRIERFKAGDRWDAIAAFHQIQSKLPKSALAH